MKKRAHGEGTVGLWKGGKVKGAKVRARIYVDLPNGEQKRVEGYADTQKEAIRKRDDKVAELIAAFPNSTTITFYQMALEWLAFKEKQGRKKSTINSYSQTLRNHLLPLFRDRAITTIDMEDVQDLQFKLTAEGKYRVAEMVATVVGAIYNFAQRKYRKEIQRGELTLVNPTDGLEPIERPAGDNEKDKVWSSSQLDDFMVLSELEYRRNKSLYYPLFYTAIATGLRRGELLGLRWPNVVHEKIETGEGPEDIYMIRVVEQLVYHHGKLYWDTPKTKTSTRDVPISKGLFNLLQAHKDKLEWIKKNTPDWQEHDLVFPSYAGSPVNPNNLRRSFDNLIRRAALPPIKFHTLRKVFATYVTKELMGQSKFPPKILQQLLGHSRPDMAMNIYTKAIDEDIRTATFDPLERKNRESGGKNRGKGDSGESKE
jgi:integrase